MNPDEQANTCEAEEEQMPEEEEEAEEEEQEETRVADSLRAKRTAADGTVEFRVRWKRATWEEDTWVAQDKLDEVMVTTFLAAEEVRAAERARTASKKPDAHAGKRKGSSFVRF